MLRRSEGAAMTTQQNPPSEAPSIVAPLPRGRSKSNWLLLARSAWIVLAVLLMAYFLVSIPVIYQAALTVCTPSDTRDCFHAPLTEGNVQALAQLHVSVPDYVGLLVAVELAGSLLGWAIGVLIFWRASREWTGLFFSLLFVLIYSTAGGAYVLAGVEVTNQTPPLVQLLVTVGGALAAVQSAAVAAFFLTFPTGRLVPRWSGVLLVLVVVIQNALPGPPPNLSPALVAAMAAAIAIVWALTYVGMVGVQVYRYLRVYNGIQRQQTKWFVFALAVNIALSVITNVPGVLVPSLGAPDSWYQLLNNPISSLAGMLVSVSVGIAILRYRLWDIDVLINRTLVYGSLTALLAALYVSLILIAQALVRVLTGSLTQQPLVLVASTLAIAALFQPLRRRIQSTIDGRFYRRKYDAAQVVAAFSTTLRQEVDLDQLREQLVAVVEETMQPSRVSVWLRSENGARKRNPAR